MFATLVLAVVLVLSPTLALATEQCTTPDSREGLRVFYQPSGYTTPCVYSCNPAESEETLALTWSGSNTTLLVTSVRPLPSGHPLMYYQLIEYDATTRSAFVAMGTPGHTHVRPAGESLFEPNVGRLLRAGSSVPAALHFYRNGPDRTLHIDLVAHRVSGGQPELTVTGVTADPSLLSPPQIFLNSTTKHDVFDLEDADEYLVVYDASTPSVNTGFDIGGQFLTLFLLHNCSTATPADLMPHRIPLLQAIEEWTSGASTRANFSDACIVWEALPGSGVVPSVFLDPDDDMDLLWATQTLRSLYMAEFGVIGLAASGYAPGGILKSVYIEFNVTILPTGPTAVVTTEGTIALPDDLAINLVQIARDTAGIAAVQPNAFGSFQGDALLATAPLYSDIDISASLYQLTFATSSVAEGSVPLVLAGPSESSGSRRVFGIWWISTDLGRVYFRAADGNYSDYYQDTPEAWWATYGGAQKFDESLQPKGLVGSASVQGVVAIGFPEAGGSGAGRQVEIVPFPAPIFVSSPNTTARAGEEYTYQPQISIVGREENIRWCLSSAPDGMVLAPNGKLSWTPGIGGVTTAELTLSVGQPYVSQTFAITVTAVAQPPDRPSLPVDQVTTDSFTLHWEPPINFPPSLTLQGFDLRVSIVGSLQNTLVAEHSLPAAARTFVVTNLQPSSLYQVALRLVTSSGLSGWSRPVSQKTATYCPPGTSRKEPFGECDPCTDTQYTEGPNALSCLPCPLGTARDTANTNTNTNTTVASIQSCVCVPGRYSLRGSGTPCSPCPVGAACVGGTSRPSALPGYVPSQSSPTVFLKCDSPSACTGGGKCGPGKGGRLCSQCQPGYFELTGSCRPCRGGLPTALMVLFVVLAFVLVGVLIHTNTRDFSKDLHVLPVLFVSVNALQIISVFARIDLEWTVVLETVYQFLTLVSFNLSLSAPECTFSLSDPWLFKWITAMTMPLVFVLIFAAMHLLSLAYRSLVLSTQDRLRASHPGMEAELEAVRTGRGSFGARARARVWRVLTEAVVTPPGLRRACVRGFVQFLTLAFFPLCIEAVSALDCVELEPGLWVLESAKYKTCGSRAWWHLFPFAITAVLLYCIAVPLALVLLLVSRARKMDEVEFFLKYSFLVGRYRSSFYWFEAAVMARKLAVVACVVTFKNPVVQAIMASLTLVLAALHLSKAQPYRSVSHNSLDRWLTVFCVFIITGGLAGDHNTLLQNILVIGGICAVFLFILSVLVWEVWKETKSNSDSFADHASQSEHDFDASEVEMHDTFEFGTDVSLAL